MCVKVLNSNNNMEGIKKNQGPFIQKNLYYFHFSTFFFYLTLYNNVNVLLHIAIYTYILDHYLEESKMDMIQVKGII